MLKKFCEFAFGNGIVLILGFFTSPLITRLISPEEMGKYSMFNTICSLLIMFLALGMDQAYIRFYNEEVHSERQNLMKKCIKLPLLNFSVVTLIVLIFGDEISRFIIGEESFLLTILLLINIGIGIINKFSLLVIRMQQNGKKYSIINILGKICYIISILFIFCIFRNSYLTVVISIIIYNSVIMIFSIMSEKKNWKFNKKDNVRVKISELLRYSYPLCISAAIIWIFQSIDKIFLNIFCSYTELGLYASAFSIVSLLNTIQTTFTVFWSPIAYQRYQEKPKDKMFFSKMNSIITVVMIFMSVMVITFKDILIYLLGSDFRESVYIIPFLTFMPMMYTMSEVTVVGINFRKKTKCHIIIAIMSALANIIGNFMLVPKFGAVGAAISTGFSYILFYIVRTLISYKLYRVDYHIFKNVILICGVIILAIMSSFSRLNIYIFLVSVGILFLTCIFYNKILIDGIKGLFKSIKKIRSKR